MYAAAQPCARCLRLLRSSAAACGPVATSSRWVGPPSPSPYLAQRRYASRQRSDGHDTDTVDAPDDSSSAASDRQARFDRLLSKARALKAQHLQQQRASQHPGAPPSTSSGTPQSKLDKYADALKRKAAQAGFDSVEAMRQSIKARQSLDAVSSSSSSSTASPSSASSTTSSSSQDQTKSSFQRKEEELCERLRARAEERRAEREKEGAGRDADAQGSSPVKPLSAIMDLNKLLTPPTDGSPPADARTVAELWTTYHTMKNKLSAVIPLETYTRLLERGRRYPRFVVPLPRAAEPGAAAQGSGSTTTEAPGASGGGGGHEMYYLEWAVLPHPTPNLALASLPLPSRPQNNSSTTKTTSSSSRNSDPLPAPSTVLFTSLAEYKLRQEFAQPSLVLTHYTDLAHSHGVVLMRGEISDAGAGGGGGGGGSGAALTDADAQRLCVTLQRFYLLAAGREDGAGSEERSELVRLFHEEPQAFDVERLIRAAAF